MIQVKTVLSNIIDGISLNLGIDKVTDLGGGRYEIECQNTQYLNTDRVVTIDSVEYTVESFVLNTSLILRGDSAPTTGLKGLPLPTFVFGKYKAVNAQLARRQPSSYLPLIWMREILDRTEPAEDEESRYDSEGIVELFFCISSRWDDWETSDHYTEAIEPMNNVVDAFIQALKSSSMVGELGAVERINHAKFSTGTGSISGAQDRSVLPAYVSAIQVRADMPIVGNCGELPDTSCLPGQVINKDGTTIGYVPSGGVLEIQTSGGGDVRNTDSSYTASVGAGDTLVLPNITVTDSDGSTSSVPSVQDVTCTPGADATVENSDSSYTNTVASGGTLVLPDITVTDSDGSTFTQASVVNVVCSLAADGTVNVNSVFFDNVASGGTLNIEVRQSSGSTLIGSKQGQYFRIPDSVITLDNTDGTTLSTTNVLATDSLTLTAPDATAVIKNTLNAVLRSELVPSNVSEDIIIGDAIININKSDGTLIASATLTAEGSGVYNVADSTINVVNTLGTVLSSNLVKATETDNVVAPDANVENSDNSYTNTVASGGTLVLPDITVTDSDGTTSSFPSVKNVVCTPATPTPPLITLYQRPTKPYQTISYATYDEAWQLANGVYNNFNQTTAVGVQVRTQILDFATDSTGNTLMYNNPFGNKDRWTDENGLQVYGNNVAIDNLTGMRWPHNIEDINFRNDPKIWSTLLSDAVAYTDSLGNSDYYVPAFEIIMTLPIIDVDQSTIGYAAGLTPNGVSGNHYFISSTTPPNYSTRFYRLALRNRAQIGFDTQSGTEFRNFAVICAILPQPIIPNP